MSTYTNPPKKCDLCEKEITSAFVDGATILGCWANMCTSCHSRMGRGLGIGLGQLYVRQNDGTYKKMSTTTLPGKKRTVIFKPSK